ncbi:MAG: Bax inhibitor-1/YccA family protein [Propionibacteriaceae bacterium]|nr:Bax inhibitor-1/YccA family protein [Propionibacteriaceae bacterium]
MANPILSRPGTFTPSGYGYPNYQNPAPGANGYGQYGYGPQTTYTPTGYGQPTTARPETMTYDSVVNKAGIMLGLLVISAALAYMFIPASLLYPAAVICGLVSIIFPFLVAGRHAAAPGLCVAYSIIEGVFIGGISQIFEVVYPGIVVQAVLATFVTAGVVFVAFRFGGFRSTPRMSKFVRIGLIAFAGMALLNLVLYFFGINLGLFPGPTGPVSLWAWVAALVGIGLALYSLLDDFTFIEHGIAIGAPEKQSWIAAYGLVVTMVFLYTQLLRVLSYIRR